MDLLNKLIADPAAIKNIKDMLGSTTEESNSEKEEKTDFYHTSNNSMDFLYEILNNQQNGEMLRKINNIYNRYSNEKTPGLELLDALKPFLSQRRVESMDKVRKAIKISNAFSELKK